jgi:hypothetical protein
LGVEHLAKRNVHTTPVRLGSGDAKSFSVAAVGLRLRSELEDRRLLLPWSFERFEDPQASIDVHAVVRSASRLEPVEGRLLFHSSLHWRALETTDSIVFDVFHPPTGEVYCRMSVDPQFCLAEVVFAEDTWLALGAHERDWHIPHPLDQLLLVPGLALRGACLFHACGASIDGRAAVFAGHSGDGKTTLAGLLSSEGTPLLSDERIAVRKTERGFVAFGTPWPGEGNVVSAASYPLGGIFILRKGPRHKIVTGSRNSLAAELLARSIVPYYLPKELSTILQLIGEIAEAVPIQELEFSLEPGLASLLS